MLQLSASVEAMEFTSILVSLKDVLILRSATALFFTRQFVALEQFSMWLRRVVITRAMSRPVALLVNPTRRIQTTPLTSGITSGVGIPHPETTYNRETILGDLIPTTEEIDDMEISFQRMAILRFLFST